MNYIKQGTPDFRKSNLALFAGGFTTFAVLYCTQPLMPEFSREFQISPTMASLSLSLSSIAMAVGMLLIGSLSEAWGRKSVMTISLLIASVIAIVTSFSSSFQMMLIFRVLLGVALAGLPAIAMAYLGEEIEPSSLGIAMGLYISGNSIGGMGGRIVTGLLADYFNWRVAVLGIGVLSIVASLMFWLLLPPSRNFQRRTLDTGKLVQSLLGHCKDPGLLCLYGIGFLLMGSFVTLYNYIGYQLVAPPYNLSQTIVGGIFIVYIVGTFSSTWMGRLSDRYGRRKVMWIVLLINLVGACLTMSAVLAVKISGIAIFTFGFFGAHSIASSWVGKRATHDRAQAASLYLFFYYMGSSVIGTAGGSFWTLYGWSGVVGIIVLLLFLALLVSIRLSFLTSPVRKQPIMKRHTEIHS